MPDATAMIEASRVPRAAIERVHYLFACPGCQARLSWTESSLQCTKCASLYPIVDGIPVFASDVLESVQNESGHLTSHKGQQARYFDQQAAEEFETERPNGTPRLYAWLLAEKLRRSTSPISARLRGATVLAVCGGSGMEAEFLAAAGAVVISSDISLGAARRAKQRALRHGVALVSIVADVERLPFTNESVDLCYVHDGLHHLVNPSNGLKEMGRVAAHYVSITEPSVAGLTSVAVKLGLATEFEEAGNRVSRLNLSETSSQLIGLGFRVLRAERYAMYYRHVPGKVFRTMSAPVLFTIVRLGWRIANRLIGKFGNKLTVVAVRSHDEGPDGTPV